MHQPDNMATIRFYDPKAPYYEFSNFYKCKNLIIDNKHWITTEQYFQAQKFTGTPYFDIIHQADSPMKAFALARQKKLAGYQAKWVVNKKTCNRHVNELVDEHKHVKIIENWDDIKLGVMKKALIAKFCQDETLKTLLLSTGDAGIEEASPRDDYWGTGKDGKGGNKLGELLMQVREFLRNE